MSKTIIKRIARILIFCILLVAIVKLLGFVLNDDTKSYTRITYHEMYQQDNIDVLFIGGSHCYRSLIPEMLDEEFGLNTFNAGSSAQSMDGSYMLMREAAKYNDIRHVYLEVFFAAAVGDKQPTATYIIADYLKPSADKYIYLLQATQSDDYANGLILARRNRKRLLKLPEIWHTFKTKLSDGYRNYSYDSVSNDILWYAGKGYVAAGGSISDWNYFMDKGYDPINIDGITDDWKMNLESFIDFCEEKKIALTLFSAPMSNFHLAGCGNYDEYVTYVRNLAARKNIDYYDFNLCREEYFPSKSELFSDQSHLNHRGAEIFSRTFAMLVKGEVSQDEMFYPSYDEKLAHLPATVFGISYCDQIDADGSTQRKCKIVSNDRKELEYSVSLIPADDCGKDDIIHASDYSGNPTFVLDADFTGKCVVRYRRVDDKKHIDEVTIDIP